MKLPKLKIGQLITDLPIVQGGMGVRVSLASLASAVANEGGIGTISGLGLGDITGSYKQFESTSVEKLKQEIKQAIDSSRNGLLAVNIMAAIRNAQQLVQTAVESGIKIVVFGAGLPMKLPEWVTDPSVNLVPIISSSRVSELILRAWKRRFGRTVDAFILEGPLAGGHLGYTRQQLDDPESVLLEKTLPAVLESLKPYEDSFGKKIPVIAAGGIYSGKDIARMLALGASGVQLGTRFVCTEECGVSPEFKQQYLDSTEEDIQIVDSPVGMPGRAIRNKFLERLDMDSPSKIKCPFRCLTACKMKEARYCIARALFNSYYGNIDEGLVFCGSNAYRVNKIVKVKELFQELVYELKAAISSEQAIPAFA